MTYSTKWPLRKKLYECQKYEKKAPIHENADANITCDIGDISRFRSRLPHGHIVSSIIVRCRSDPCTLRCTPASRNLFRSAASQSSTLPSSPESGDPRAEHTASCGFFRTSDRMGNILLVHDEKHAEHSSARYCVHFRFCSNARVRSRSRKVQLNRSHCPLPSERHTACKAHGQPNSRSSTTIVKYTLLNSNGPKSLTNQSLSCLVTNG